MNKKSTTKSILFSLVSLDMNYYAYNQSPAQNSRMWSSRGADSDTISPAHFPTAG